MRENIVFHIVLPNTSGKGLSIVEGPREAEPAKVQLRSIGKGVNDDWRLEQSLASGEYYYRLINLQTNNQALLEEENSVVRQSPIRQATDWCFVKRPDGLYHIISIKTFRSLVTQKLSRENGVRIQTDSDETGAIEQSWKLRALRFL